MTTNPPDRLNRIEAILGTLASNQADDREQLSRIEQLIESNAKAIVDVTNMITTQVAIKRIEFRAAEPQILKMLAQRFTSNGQ